MAPSEDINTANKYLFIGNKRTSQLRKLQINLIDLFCANFSTSQIVKSDQQTSYYVEVNSYLIKLNATEWVQLQN